MKRATLTVLLALGASAPAWSESLTLHQVLQRTVDRDVSLRISGMQVDRADRERDRVESQLGWVLGAEGGVARDVNNFGVPVERTDVGGSLQRQLESGSSVELAAGVVREDADAVLIPTLPNPSQTTTVDLRYRMPLAKGTENAGYNQGLVSAEAGAEGARAEWETSRDQLVRHTADLFYSAALTRARLDNATAAIARAERFKQYIANNLQLGVTETKDRLQAEAQWRARVAEHRSLSVVWENQRTTLNRLMERGWDSEWQPVVVDPAPMPDVDLRALETEAGENSADLKREYARLRSAEASLASRQDAVRDQADLVFSVGNRAVEGDLAGGGSVSESERVAALRFEYRAALDRRGSDAEVTQAYIDRAIAQQRIESVQTELRYTVARLTSEIASAEAALEQARGRKAAEQAKLDDAQRRYRQGRIDTAQVIQFENDYEAAALALEQQIIELARRHTELELVRGVLWQDLVLPSATTGEGTP